MENIPKNFGYNFSWDYHFCIAMESDNRIKLIFSICLCVSLFVTFKNAFYSKIEENWCWLLIARQKILHIWMHIKPESLIVHKSLVRHLDQPMDYYRPTDFKEMKIRKELKKCKIKTKHSFNMEIINLPHLFHVHWKTLLGAVATEPS